jgi:PAS domain S-box-containing protein
VQQMSEHLTKEAAVHNEAEKSLRLMKFAVDHASDSLFWIRPDAAFAYVNDSTCRRLGYTRDELLTMTVFDVDPAFPREAWAAHWREIKERKSFTIETTHKTKTGEAFPVEVSVNYVEYEGAEYNFAFARDISERKKAEDALRKAKEELEKKVIERTAELHKANEDLLVELEERKRTEDLIEKERKRMDVILSALNTGLSLINPDMTIAWVNQKIREMFPGREPVGQICHLFYESRPTICDG